jgi:hypothetical protein
MERIDYINFVNWCEEDELRGHYIPEGPFGPYYTASPKRSLNDLRDALNIPLERSSMVEKQTSLLGL